MPAVRNPVLERRVRRADLSTLQGIERLAKRRARQLRVIAPPLIRIDLRAVFLEPHWTPKFRPASTSFTLQPTDTVRRSPSGRTG